MVINLTLNDATKKNILPHLQTTNDLLGKVATKLSQRPLSAQIYAMPDLGIAQNVTRMMGGFYTGACYTWQSDVPFVPIDATVNVCGITVYKLKKEISNLEFVNRVNKVINNRQTYTNFIKQNLDPNFQQDLDLDDATKFYWNYDHGNHFIIFAESNGEYGLPKGQYMIVHASAIEFKKDNRQSGLYPVQGNWYYDDIQTEYDATKQRYLRYIVGDKAKRFYQIATYLQDFNKIRNRYFCEQVLGDLADQEIINISHYGMPTPQTICIGTQWEQNDYALLTAPGNDIFLVHPETNNHHNVTLTPHGCGVRTNQPEAQITYTDHGIIIGNKPYQSGDSVNIGVETTVRTKDMTATQLEAYINEILAVCPGHIFGRLKQRWARTKYGDITYQEDNHITPQQFNQFKTMAEQGDAVQQSNLAVCYCNGWHVEKNLDLAIKWYRASADQGYLEAKRALGDCYAELKDWNNALYWWRLAAKENHPQALFFLGTLYFYGHDVKVDLDKTKQYLQLAWRTQNTNVHNMITNWCQEVHLDVNEFKY